MRTEYIFRCFRKALCAKLKNLQLTYKDHRSTVRHKTENAATSRRHNIFPVTVSKEQGPQAARLPVPISKTSSFVSLRYPQS